MRDFILTAWQWGAISGALFLLELLFVGGGTFILCLGFSSALTGLLVFLMPEVSMDTQLIVFAVLSVISLVLWKKFFKKPMVDEGTLNQRGSKYVGTTHVLETPISAGEGVIILDDTRWIIKGPDMPKGTKVLLKDLQNGIFQVEKA